MPRGAPDYFGTGVFPRTGSTTVEIVDTAATASTDIDVLTLSFKGILQRCNMSVVGVATCDLDVMALVIDGVEIFSARFTDLLQTTFEQSPVAAKLVRYQVETFTFAWAMPGPLYVETSVKITYDEKYGRTPALHPRAWYSPYII